MASQFRRILICPLDWGIGHAARCIPIIRQLNALGHTVMIAASGSSKALLQRHFPQLTIIDFPSVEVRYSRGKHLWLRLFLQMPGYLFGIFRENRRLQGLIREFQIDTVISDNRFGCWSRKVPSVYITHQVNLISPLPGSLFSPLLARLHHFIIRRYNECWIPDLPEHGGFALAGRLSHPVPSRPKFHYIGWLSRFAFLKINPLEESGYLLVILSGPEPQRSILEEKVLRELKGQSLKIIRGLPAAADEPPPVSHVEWFNHADDRLFEQLVAGASGIICRSGYSTLMDLIMLGRSAHLIPTPGQSEQEYLARHLSEAGIFTFQDQFKPLQLPVHRVTDFDNMRNKHNTDTLDITLAGWLHRIKS